LTVSVSDGGGGVERVKDAEARHVLMHVIHNTPVDLVSRCLFTVLFCIGPPVCGGISGICREVYWYMPGNNIGSDPCPARLTFLSHPSFKGLATSRWLLSLPGADQKKGHNHPLHTGRWPLRRLGDKTALSVVAILNMDWGSLHPPSVGGPEHSRSGCAVRAARSFSDGTCQHLIPARQISPTRRPSLSLIRAYANCTPADHHPQLPIGWISQPLASQHYQRSYLNGG
jgi:hypothetical protein